MKKKLLYFILFMASGVIQSQNLYNYGFDGVTQDMLTAGWVQNNQSAIRNFDALWQISSEVVSPIPEGQSGGANSFCQVNYMSTTSSTGATISNWLISPTINVKNGDVVTFYTKAGQNPKLFADRLQLRMSTNGSATKNPSMGSEDLGDFTVLIEDINPNLDLTSYPAAWTKYSYTIGGLLGIIECKFAFRYYVTDGGEFGKNSDLIYVDSFSVDRTPLSAEGFVAENFSVYPNPSKQVLNITSKSNATINEIQITDLNGRIVKKSILYGLSTAQINVDDLNVGVYFLKVVSDQGIGTTKFLKN